MLELSSLLEILRRFMTQMGVFIINHSQIINKFAVLLPPFAHIFHIENIYTYKMYKNHS